MPEKFIELNIHGLTELIRDLEILPEAISAAAQDVGYIIKANQREFIIEAFEETLVQAGPDFPEAYSNHLRRSFNLITVALSAIGNSGVSIIFTDPTELGDQADLEEGYHYQAIEETGDYPYDFSVSSPPRVDLPGPDQSLWAYVSRSGDRRQEYWDALSSGQTSFPVDFHNYSREMPIPAGAYQHTFEARVRLWGGRYPEWIILHDGSPGGNPYSLPTDFGGILKRIVEREIQPLIEDEVYRIVDEINAGKAQITRNRNGKLTYRGQEGNLGQFRSLRRTG